MRRGAHDVGGLQEFGVVPRTEEEHARWHESVMRLLMSSGRFGLSRFSGETRYIVETLDPNTYRSLGYYERWVVAIAGLYSRLAPDAAAPMTTGLDDAAGMSLAARATSEAPADPPLAIGTMVWVLREPPAGHHRLPGYTWGRRGKITAAYAPQEVPGCPVEALRYEHVYNVAFTSDELWGDGGRDELRIDLFASYLTPTEEDG
jgi:nitrile hydratase